MQAARCDLLQHDHAHKCSNHEEGGLCQALALHGMSEDDGTSSESRAHLAGINAFELLRDMPEVSEKNVFRQVETEKPLSSAAPIAGTSRDEAEDTLAAQNVDFSVCAGIEQNPDFVSRSTDMKKVLTVAIAKANTSVVLHRLGDSLFLDGEVHAGDEGRANEKPSSAVLADNIFSFGLSDDHCPRSEAPSSSSGSSDTFDAIDASGHVPGCPSAGTAAADYRIAGAQKKNGSQQNCGVNFSGTCTLTLNGLTSLLAQDSVMVIRESFAGGDARVAHVEGQLSAEHCLDLWLENILNGADTLALCYHKDGKIQV
jgi:hypothetical protein